MKTLIVLDNNGKTFDRFTIIHKPSGEIIGASERPFSPLGFGQHCGNVAHNYWRTVYGYGWDKVDAKLLRKRIKFAIDHFMNDLGNIGKPIDFKSLPPDVQRFAKQAF